MSLISLQQALRHSSANRYAVGAFNVISLDFLEAVLNAAEAGRSPVILNIAEVHFQYVTLENICPAIRDMASRATVPVVLNLDHGQTFEAVIRSIKNGFTSIMFDGSHLEYEENVRQTAELTRICHAVGVSMEAELGAVGGEEGGGLVGSADPARYTDPAQAADYVRRTGVDALAVAIGNSHGKYKGEPKLDFDRLEKVRDAAGVPLVLHGGSGISERDFKKAISLGISKINFYTGMSQAALEATDRALKDTGAHYNDYPEMISRVKKEVSRVVTEQMKIFGSTGICTAANTNCLACGNCKKDLPRRAAAPAAPPPEDLDAMITRITRQVLQRLQ